MSINYNLYVEQGADFSTVITVYENDGTAKDLTDYVAESQMRRSYTSTTSVAINATVTNPTAGQITLSMDAATTATLRPGRYVYDLIITDPAPTITRVMEGIVTVSPCVTRDDV